MDRMDYSSIMRLVYQYSRISLNQPDLFNELFRDYYESYGGKDASLDPSNVSKVLRGYRPAPQSILDYYEDKRDVLKKRVAATILPQVLDPGMLRSRLYDLLMLDRDIGKEMQAELLSEYPNSLEAFLADILHFGMTRPFYGRDKHGRSSYFDKNLSPSISDYIMDASRLMPCRAFCGREQDLQDIHDLLQQNGCAFLCGTAGLGKSELSRMYANKQQQYYTNIIYLTYHTSLQNTIASIPFRNDRPEDSPQERFDRHIRVLQAMQADTLLIIDSMDVPPAEDPLLGRILSWRCCTLITTRCDYSDYPHIRLMELSDTELLQLVSHYYPVSPDEEEIITALIHHVGRHTLAVELIARLLRLGRTSPADLLEIFCREPVAESVRDRIHLIKDWVDQRDTYLGHIRTLFALYALEEDQLSVLRYMSLMPLQGIHATLFANWCGLENCNLVDDLIEAGLIQSRPDESRQQVLFLHSLLQELCTAELEPSDDNCRVLIDNLQHQCLQHGQTHPHYVELFQTVENSILMLNWNDTSLHLRYLEDTFAGMLSYRWDSGLQTILAALKYLINDSHVGTERDVALFLDCQAAYLEMHRGDLGEILQLQLRALGAANTMPEQDPLLLANLHNNLGGTFQQFGKVFGTVYHYQKAFDLITSQDTPYQHDLIPILSNCSQLLSIADRIPALKRLARMVYRSSGRSLDYAEIQMVLGSTYLECGKKRVANLSFHTAMTIYRATLGEESAVVQEKQRQIAELQDQLTRNHLNG